MSIDPKRKFPIELVANFDLSEPRLWPQSNKYTSQLQLLYIDKDAYII
jgi:hypothetical protein